MSRGPHGDTHDDSHAGVRAAPRAGTAPRAVALRRAAATVLVGGATVAIFVPHPVAPAVALLSALAAAAGIEPRALARSGLRRRLLLLVAFGVVTAAVVALGADLQRGVAVALAACARFATLSILFTLLARHADVERLVAWARRGGVGRVGLVFGLALNTLPQLALSLRESATALAIRRRRRRPALRDLPRLLEVQLAHAARIADDAAAAAALRGHAALARGSIRAPQAPAMVVVTGRSGAGKTRAIAGAAERLRAGGAVVAGILQPGTFENDEKSGFNVRDLTTGDERLLARRSSNPAYGKRFSFEEAAFAFSRQVLAAVPAGAVVVVDELGPLELRGAGHLPALRRLLRRTAPTVLVCGVRRNLVPAFLDLLRPAGADVIDVELTVDPVTAIAAAVGRAPRRG